MDEYESPTIEQAGGPNNHVEPTSVIAAPLLFVFAVLDIVAVTQIAVAAELVLVGIGLWIRIATPQNG